LQSTAEGANIGRQAALVANVLGAAAATVPPPVAARRSCCDIAGSPRAFYVTELLKLPYLRRNKRGGRRKKRKKIKEVLTRFRYFGYKRGPTLQINST